MINRADFEKFQKQDNSAILEFLSSAASALSSSDAISSKECADLRISFRNMYHLINQQDASLLHYLADEKNDFLRVLLSRYGVITLGINLFRFTTTPYVNQFNEILSQFGLALIEKSDLFFNRLFGIYVKDSCESKFLFAGVITRLSAFVEKNSRICVKLSEQLRTFYPSNMVLATEADHKIDQLIAKHLGFTNTEQDYLPYFQEKCMSIQLAASVLSLITAIDDFLVQFKQNGYEGSTSSIELNINWIKGECGKLFNQEFAITNNLHHQEDFRRNICGCLFTVVGAFKKLADDVIALLTPSCFGKNEEFSFSEDIRRRIASDLITKFKTAPNEAEMASRLLLQYCNRLSLNPNDLIQGELTKIHPSLTLDALNVIQTAQNTYSLASTHSLEKKTIVETSSALRASFSNILKGLIAVLVASFSVFNSSCGIKTAPRSEIEDFRPELPSQQVLKNTKSDKNRMMIESGETR